MSDPSSESKATQQAARADFEAALRKGFWRGVWSWLTQSKNELLPFDEVRRNLPFAGQHSLGVQQIPMEQIVGSVGRYRDFDCAFLPRQTRTRGRWESIDAAHLQDVPLPPIQTYKVGELYFVSDGNHRVSVARERGQAFIDAEVIAIDVDAEITPNMDIDEIIRRVEQAEFARQTGLKERCPESEVRLTLPGGYQKLLEHISAHRYFMGIDQQREISWEEAVVGWCEQVYQPLVEVIRSQNILKEFPGRTETDLYLWVIEHLWYLREETSGEVSLEEAAVHFAGEFSQNPLSILLSMIGRIPPAVP